MNAQDEKRARLAAKKIEEAREARRLEKDKQELIAKYKYLIPILDDRCLPDNQNPNWLENCDKNRKILTKNIKAHLKHCFPNTRFSVKRNNFSMGFDYSVSWEGDPDVEAVKDAVSIFYYDTESNMDDSMTVTQTLFTRCFGGMTYMVHTHRVKPKNDPEPEKPQSGRITEQDIDEALANPLNDVDILQSEDQTNILDDGYQIAVYINDQFHTVDGGGYPCIEIALKDATYDLAKIEKSRGRTGSPVKSRDKVTMIITDLAECPDVLMREERPQTLNCAI